MLVVVLAGGLSPWGLRDAGAEIDVGYDTQAAVIEGQGEGVQLLVALTRPLIDADQSPVLAQGRAQDGDALAAVQIGGGLIQLTKLNDGRTRNGDGGKIALLVVIAGNHIDAHGTTNIAQCLSTEIDPVLCH